MENPYYRNGNRTHDLSACWSDISRMEQPIELSDRHARRYNGLSLGPEVTWVSDVIFCRAVSYSGPGRRSRRSNLLQAGRFCARTPVEQEMWSSLYPFRTAMESTHPSVKCVPKLLHGDKAARTWCCSPTSFSGVLRFGFKHRQVMGDLDTYTRAERPYGPPSL